MSPLGKRACALAALSVLIAPASASETTPRSLQGKRAGLQDQATQSPLNMIYTPIEPCHLLAVNLRPNFYANYGVSFPERQCRNVPGSARAISFIIAAGGAKNSGSVWLYPGEEARPLNPTFYFWPNKTTGSSAIVPINIYGVLGLYSTSWVQVKLDVIGYFEPQLWAYVESSGELGKSSGRTTSVTKTGTGSYTVAFDRDVGACAGVASPDPGGRMTSVNTAGNVANVSVFNQAGVASDAGFSLHVRC